MTSRPSPCQRLSMASHSEKPSVSGSEAFRTREALDSAASRDALPYLCFVCVCVFCVCVCVCVCVYHQHRSMPPTPYSNRGVSQHTVTEVSHILPYRHRSPNAHFHTRVPVHVHIYIHATYTHTCRTNTARCSRRPPAPAHTTVIPSFPLCMHAAAAVSSD